MAEKLGKWSSNRGLISKIRPSDGCKGMPFPWRGNGGTISTNLDVIWGMSVDIPVCAPMFCGPPVDPQNTEKAVLRHMAL